MTKDTISVLAVDFDDVVAGFNAAYCNYHNETYGTALNYDDITTFDMCKLWQIDHKTLLGRVRTFCHKHHDQIQPVADVVEVLPRLAGQYELHLVTSRCESLEEISLEWLKAYGLDLFTEYHFTNGFGTMFPDRKRSKLEVCRSIGAQYLIEDAPENAQLVAEGGVTVLVPDRPWNQTLTEHPNIVPAITDWQHIERLLSR